MLRRKCNFGLGNGVLDMVPNAQYQKKKIDKLDFVKMKNSASKFINKKVKRQVTEKKNIFANFISISGLVSDYKKEFLQLNNSKPPNLKMGKVSLSLFLFLSLLLSVPLTSTMSLALCFSLPSSFCLYLSLSLSLSLCLCLSLPSTPPTPLPCCVSGQNQPGSHKWQCAVYRVCIQLSLVPRNLPLSPSAPCSHLHIPLALSPFLASRAPRFWAPGIGKVSGGTSPASPPPTPSTGGKSSIRKVSQNMLKKKRGGGWGKGFE